MLSLEPVISMNRKLNIIDFETGRSVGITVDDEDLVDTLLGKVKNYWVKQGDYVLTYGGGPLVPVCLIKDYDIRDEDMLQFRARSTLSESGRSGISPRRPEGIVYPDRCPKCGPVEFRYISPIEFQCTVCGGVLQKQPSYAPVEPLDRFLREGESFMDFIPEEAENDSGEVENFMVSDVHPPEVEPASAYQYTPPPRIVSPSASSSERQDTVGSTAGKKPPRILGPPKAGGPTGSEKEFGQFPGSDAKPDIAGRSGLKAPSCNVCEEPMRFVQLYDMWWCDRCEKYLGEDNEGTGVEESVGWEESVGDEESVDENVCKTYGAGEENGTEARPADGEQDREYDEKPVHEGVGGNGSRNEYENDDFFRGRAVSSETSYGLSKMSRETRDLPEDPHEERWRKLERLRELTVLPGSERGNGENGGEEEDNGGEELTELTAVPLTAEDDGDFLVHRGMVWLEEHIGVVDPRKVRTRFIDDTVCIKYRTDGNGVCVIEMDTSGEDVRLLYFRASSYGESPFGDDDEL